MERQAVDIGDGQLEAVVSGEGPVTVVFENGLATPLEFWDGVIAAVADRARTVRYDHRAESPSGALKPRSACAIVNDLESSWTRSRSNRRTCWSATAGEA